MRSLSLLLGLMAIGLLASPAAAAAETQGDLWELLDLGPMERFVEEVNRDLARYGRPLEARDLLGMFRGEAPLTLGEIMDVLAGFFLGELRLNLSLLGQLVALGVLAALMEGFHDSLGGARVGRVASMVLCVALLVLGLASLTAALTIAERTVDTLAGFMLASLPLMVSLLLAAGAVSSAAIFNPLLIMVVHGVGVIIADWVFPLLFLGCVITVLGQLGPEFKVSQLAKLISQVALTLLGVCFTVFLGVVTVQGAAGAVADGVTLRTAKFLAKTAVPVVGGLFADAAEMVAGSALLLKNAAGVLGLVVVLALVTFPLLRLVGLIVVYRLAAAVIQPLGGERAASILEALASGMTGVALAVGGLGVMFFIALTAMMAAANVAVMLR